MNLIDQIICEIDKGLKYSLDNYQKQVSARRSPLAAQGIGTEMLADELVVTATAAGAP